MIAKEIKFEDIKKGDHSSFEVTITESDVQKFAELSGDYNPLHIDEAYAKETEFGGQVVHGMFLGSLVSRFVGMELPGKKALLMKEMLEFKKPARIGDRVAVEGTVVYKSESLRLIELLMEISTEKELLVSGSVYVRVLS
ncbi:MAG: MaoC family dehydratase [Candidatus Parcubacteria bacterium]|nr:MaoC family dehydratase [Candidatus Parcubacteria bacterium]